MKGIRVRGQDNWGNGRYGATRKKKSKRYLHEGADLLFKEGEKVHALAAGVVTRIGYPYHPDDPQKGHFRYVQISVDGVEHRYFYVAPLVTLGQEISKGQPIGEAQGIANGYPGMGNHVHFEIKEQGKALNPNLFLSEFLETDLEYVAYRVDETILIRLPGNGYYSTAAASIDAAKAAVDRECELNPNFKISSNVVDWSHVE